jgi:predicted nucleic acid-binding protein
MRKETVYWDANVFLALINNDKTQPEMDKCKAVWDTACKERLILMTSTLTNAEVIYIKGGVKLDPSKRERVTNFFRQAFIVQRPVTRRISELARDIVWDKPIKPKDAVHIATAVFYKVGIFHTFDDALLKIGLLKNGQGDVDVNSWAVQFIKPSSSGTQMEMEYDAQGTKG